MDRLWRLDSAAFSASSTSLCKVCHVLIRQPFQLEIQFLRLSTKGIGFSVHLYHKQSEAKEKYRGMFETQKSGNKTSSGEIGLDIRRHISPKVGQDQVSAGVSVLCWHAAPVANVLWKPRQLGNKSNTVIRAQSVTVKNWCNVLSMEGVTVYIWSSSRMSCTIRERGTSYCLIGSPYRP